MIRLRFWKRRADAREIEEARCARRLALHADARPLGDDRTARLLIASVAGVLVLAAAWAAVTPVTETVTGEGRILPVGGARPAQTLNGGLVSAVLVTDGEKVNVGQTLVVFDRTEERLALRQLEARWEGRMAERARLAAVAANEVFDAPDTAAGREQAKAHAADLALDEAIVNRLQTLVRSTRKQIAFAVRRVNVLHDELVLADTAERRARELLARGSTTTQAVEDATRFRLRVSKDLAEAESLEAETRVAAAEAALALARHVTDRRAKAAERAAALSVEIAELEEEIARMRERVQRDRVVAPVAGRIQNLDVRDAGQAVPEGSTVARIVPDDIELFAEMRVSADRVGDVAEGLKASVKVLAFDYSRFGAIPAEVISISPSSDVDEAGNVFFRVRLRLETDQVAGIEVRQGLSVMADLKTGEKTVLEYFAKPLRVLKDRALSEA